MTNPTESRLAAANAARQRASAVTRRVRAGQLDLVAVLTALDPEYEEVRAAASAVRIERLIRYIPGFGDHTVRVVCMRAQVERVARLGSLSDTARGRLAAQLQQFDTAGYSGSGYARRAR